MGKVDVLSTAASSVAAASLSPKSLDAAGFHPVVNGLVDDLDTHIKDSNSVMAKPLDIL